MHKGHSHSRGGICKVRRAHKRDEARKREERERRVEETLERYGYSKFMAPA